MGGPFPGAYVSSGGAGTGNLDGTGSANEVAFFVDADTLAGDSNFTWTAANGLNLGKPLTIAMDPPSLTLEDTGGTLGVIKVDGGFMYLQESGDSDGDILTLDLANALVGINKASSIGGMLHVQTSASDVIGGIFQGSASQSANLIEGQNSSGDVVFSVKDCSGIGETYTDGLVLANNAAATVGTDQYAPSLRLRGYAWETSGGSSDPVDWKLTNRTEQGATARSYLMFRFSINGGAYTNAGYIDTADNEWNLTNINVSGTTIFGGVTYASGGNYKYLNAYSSSADQYFQLYNSHAAHAAHLVLGDTTGQIMFGGLTASSPALKPNSTTDEATYIGSEEVTWGSGSDPSSQNITVPSDAEAVYMFWTFFSGSSGDGLASVTLNGGNPDQAFELPEGASDETATGVCVWYNPPTGIQALDVAWDGSPSEGPTTSIAYVKGGDLSAWRDAAADHKTGSTAPSASVNSNTDDLILAHEQNYTGSPPAVSGWTSKLTGDNGHEYFRLSSCDNPGASTTTFTGASGGAYGSVVVVSIPAGAGGSVYLETKLADDSAYTIHAASYFQTQTAEVTATDGDATAAFTANMVNGTGTPATAAQDGWIAMKNSAGTTVYVPCWQ